MTRSIERSAPLPRRSIRLLSFALSLSIAATAAAQQSIPITGDRLAGTVIPVEPLAGEIALVADRAQTWTVDDTKRILLEGDVSVRIASYEFTAQAAVVWINRLPTGAGVVNQIAVYFDRVDNFGRRGGVGVAGGRLLVTAAARGDVVFRSVLREQGRPRTAAIVQRGAERLALYRRQLEADPPPPLEHRPQVERPAAGHEYIPMPGGVVEPRDYALPTRIELPAVDRDRPWLREPGSVLRLAYGAIHVESGADENVITITGSVVVEYFSGDPAEELSQFTLSAERAVLFTDPGSLEEMTRWELDPSIVRGIYLEGNVDARANDGEYYIRSPHVYYDFETDRALMLDAVLRTYDRGGRLPVYSRAEEMRQLAADQWDAKRVRVSTSEFSTGHLSLGAERLTVTRRPGSPGDGAEEETWLDARNIALRAGTVPLFAWPSFTGTVRDVPLRRASFGNANNDSLGITTSWDLLSLVGGERPDGVDAELKLDGYFDRGPALGFEIDYDVGRAVGNVDVYGMYDAGEDLTSSGFTVAPSETFRGLALWEHNARLGQDWNLQAQTSWISDETYVTSWRSDDFEERREYETSVYLKQQRDRTALTILGSYSLNDFISNSYLLASAAYTVNKAPELAHRTLGQPLFDDQVLYTGETRLTRMQLAFQQGTPAELGVSGRAFGIGDDDSIPASLRAAGLSTRWVNRFDTRQELSLPTEWGILNITPFVVGRLTAYDTNIEIDNDDSSDTVRWFGAAGLRVDTQFSHVDNSVENRLLDLHRMRHIIEPSLTLWYGSANISDENLPIYDLDVESLATGSVARVGLRNVWQTKRGGPGRWASADFLTLDTDVVFNSNDDNRASPTPQFFDYRPEYSQFGDHIRAAMVWLLSDTFSITGEGTYDLDDSLFARGSIGAQMRHSPVLTTFVEYRYIEASSNELLGVGWDYKITPKYRVGVTPQWDFLRDEFRSLNVRVIRSFPDFDVNVAVRYDQVEDVTTVSASLNLAEF